MINLHYPGFDRKLSNMTQKARQQMKEKKDILIQQGPLYFRIAQQDEKTEAFSNHKDLVFKQHREFLLPYDKNKSELNMIKGSKHIFLQRRCKIAHNHDKLSHR